MMPIKCIYSHNQSVGIISTINPSSVSLFPLHHMHLVLLQSQLHAMLEGILFHPSLTHILLFLLNSVPVPGSIVLNSDLFVCLSPVGNLQCHSSIIPSILIRFVLLHYLFGDDIEGVSSLNGEMLVLGGMVDLVLPNKLESLIGICLKYSDHSLG